MKKKLQKAKQQFTVKHAVFCAASVLLVLFASAAMPAAADTDGTVGDNVDKLLKVMSYNVLCTDITDERATVLINNIVSFDPDTVGMQEVTSTWIKTFTNRGLLNSYTFVGNPRANGGEYNNILFKTEKFNLIDSGTYWLTNTPTISSKVKGSLCNRIMTYVILERKSDGVRFMHVNTHLDHGSEEVRNTQVKYLLTLVGQIKTEYGDNTLPVIFTGDFNAVPDSIVYQTMVNSGCDDSRNLAINLMPDAVTFGKKIIDYCFISEGDFLVKSFATGVGKAGSDHYPVYVELVISNGIKVVKIPAGSNFIYTSKTLTGVSSGEGYTLTGTYTAVNAGAYTAVAALDANHIWSDGSTGTKQILWSIAKKPISVPTAVSGLVYTGQIQTGVKTGTGYTLTGNTGTNAGSYTAVASLIDPQNYKWGDGTGAPKNILWEIARKPVGIPALISGIVYNGGEQTGVKAYTGSAISGNTGTNAGTYTAEASLTDPLNYQWTDGTTGSRLISWHISYRTIIPKWPDTSSFVYDGNEHTFIPEAANIVENEDVNLFMSGTTSALEPGKYLVEITGITGADAENYRLPSSSKETKKNWNIAYSGDDFCLITELKETEKYDGGRIFAGTVSLDGVTDLIAGTIGFTLQASDSSISISDIEPADAKSSWQFAVNSETGGVSFYGGKKTITGKTPLVTFTARVPDTASFPAEITVVLDSLVCGPSYSAQVRADLSGIAVISAEITEEFSQSKLTARMPEPPVITTGRILIPVCLENDIDFAGFMAVIANDIPGVSVKITDEEPIPGCFYSKNNPDSPKLKISGFTLSPVYDSSIHLFTLDVTVTDSSVSHVSIPVVLDELISDEKGDVALDYVQTEYDIVLDVNLLRSPVQPVIEVKPFNAETRAEIDVTYQCPASHIVELCDKDDCLVSVYSTNPAVVNGASLLLPESSGFETYVKDIDYTYDDDGFLRFSEDRKSMPANEETFVFRSDYCLGDVNQDGKVTGADATAICNKLLAEKPVWTAEEIFYGRTFGGVSSPTVLDAVNIVKYAVGLVDADYKPAV